MSWGAGIARFITPTSAVVMAGIALAGVRYDRWIRFMLPLMARSPLCQLTLTPANRRLSFESGRNTAWKSPCGTPP